MIHKAKKLDKRYLGGDNFKYMIEVNRSVVPNYSYPNTQYTHTSTWRLNEFFNMRVWAWELWGPSCEINSYLPLNKDFVWSWDNEHGRMRFYLKSDKELSWFLLKWNKNDA